MVTAGIVLKGSIGPWVLPGFSNNGLILLAPHSTSVKIGHVSFLNLPFYMKLRKRSSNNEIHHEAVFDTSFWSMSPKQSHDAISTIYHQSPTVTSKWLTFVGEVAVGKQNMHVCLA